MNREKDRPPHRDEEKNTDRLRRLFAGRGLSMENEYAFSDLDQHLFANATHYEVYKKLGAHPTCVDGVEGTQFAVWAPNAQRVSVIGDFNGWDTEANVIYERDAVGVWQTFIPGVGAGMLYKFFIIGYHGEHLYKADPFASHAELRPGTASIVSDLRNLNWTDQDWMARRANFDVQKDPMIIYECHIGSWMKHPEVDGYVNGFYTYREFAERAADYLLDMGYTHIELMGIAEHPFDGSWGYQVTGYYAPTSRYGNAEDFQYMVNYFHNKGIGVILDWVPAHFPKDEAGLACFDGTCVYEHQDPRQGEHPDWGTKIYNYGRNEVRNFLIANALYWVEFFHCDGLRVDAVASMLYLDYGKQDGQWVANRYGENKNLEAIELFHHLNSILPERNAGAIMIAEESTAWPKVTGDVKKEDGLGFTLKWNMGWMNDFLEYMKLDPYFRRGNHYKLTFSTSYAFSERYVLVLSHDEVVHLKCSMWSKMPGIYEDKFHNLRCGYTFMTGHPGKKLLFMGQEFGQQREWSEERELDWYLLATDLNRELQDYVRDLWNIYRYYPALHATDFDPEGFEWVNADDMDRSIYSFIRKAPDGQKNLLFVVNMTPMHREDYVVGVPANTEYRLILNSMDPRYGGLPEHYRELGVYHAMEGECDRFDYRIAYDLPPYGSAIFEFSTDGRPARGLSPAERRAIAEQREAAKAAAEKAVEEAAEKVRLLEEAAREAEQKLAEARAAAEEARRAALEKGANV